MTEQYIRILDDVTDLVRADGLPRVVRAINQDGIISQHVVYLDGTTARSMPATDWPPPLPVNPTPEESAAAVQARQQAVVDAANATAQLRQQVLGLAQSTVGMRVDAAFTNAQIRSLLAVLLHKAGALNNDLTIRPLGDWIDRR